MFVSLRQTWRVGVEGGRAIREVIRSAAHSGENPLAVAMGLFALVVGSTAVFAELKSALNYIWGVEVALKRNAIVGFIFDRLLSFTVVLGVGFMLLASLAVSALLAGAQAVLTE